MDYCIAASRVSAYYGETVIVDGLQAKPEFNGKSVLLTGFDGPRGRCVVQLEESDGLSKREMSIKPSNLFQSVGGPCIEDKERNLVNDQDRTGTTPVSELIMSDRDDVVEFLLEKYGCSLDLKGADEMSLRGLALQHQDMQALPLNRVIKKYVRQDDFSNCLNNQLNGESEQLPPDFQSYVDFMNGNGMDQECLALIAEIDKVTSPTTQNSIFRRLLDKAGTNVNLNDEQNIGDGDQRPPSTTSGRQILRTLWFKGGDIGNGTMWNPCPPVMNFTIHGDAVGVRTMLEDVLTKTSKDHLTMLPFVLESRSSSLRWSPLMVCVGFLSHPKIMQHNTINNQSNHVGVAVTYLRYGARPDIKDVMGKNIVHYGAGVWATPRSMLIVDYCIAAARVSAFYDQRVVIDGLQSSPELNRKSVILTGFDGPSGRCVVNLEESPGGPRRELSIKPCNLFESVGGPCIENVNRKLVNDQDRTGLTALHQVIMSTRDDVIEYLVNKHGCSMDLKDSHGVSTRDLAVRRDLPVLINRSLRKLAREKGLTNPISKQREERMRCSNCQKQEDLTSKQLFYICSKCNITSYCSQECQRADWKKHKKMCKEYSVGIKLDRPNRVPAVRFWATPVTGCFNSDVNSYRVAKGVPVGQLFWVKVLYDSDEANMLVFDKTRTCCFLFIPESSGFVEIASIIKSHRPQVKNVSGETMCFFRASFDSQGDLFHLSKDILSKDMVMKKAGLGVEP